MNYPKAEKIKLAVNLEMVTDDGMLHTLAMHIENIDVRSFTREELEQFRLRLQDGAWMAFDTIRRQGFNQNTK